MSFQNQNRRGVSAYRSEKPEAFEKSEMIFGIRPVIEAVMAGKDMDKVLIQKGLKGELFHQLRAVISDFKIPFQVVPAEKLDRITRSNHQGVIALTSPITFYDIDAILSEKFNSGKSPKILVLDEVTDVRNFGALCRTAECQGFDAVVIPEKGSAAINADAVKTSAGALHHLPVCRIKSLKTTCKFLQDSGLKLIAASEKGVDSPYDVDLSGPVAIIMGSEERGVHPDLIKMADSLVRIPMSGKTSSMNVSVAAGIFMYEVNRQHQKV